jgi:hypothetical protein
MIDAEPLFGVPWERLEPEQVKRLLAEGETEPLLWEAKGTELKPGEVRAQVCGFANSHDGGFLILGARWDRDESRWVPEDRTSSKSAEAPFRLSTTSVASLKAWREKPCERGDTGPMRRSDQARQIVTVLAPGQLSPAGGPQGAPGGPYKRRGPGWLV